MDSLMIAMWLSNSCHRICDHCYSNPLKSNEKMSLETGKEVALWIKTICQEESVKNLHIQILGGEPLNNTNVMFQISDVLAWKSHKEFEGIGTRFVLFTNGDLLTKEIMAELKSRKIMILFNPTYDSLNEIERKILMIKRGVGGCSMSVALTDINLDRLEDLAKLAVKHNCHIRTNRLYDGGVIPGYVVSYKTQMKRLFNILLDAKKSMWPNWIMESTYPTWNSQKNPYSCGKWYGNVHSDGSIYSCNPDQDTKIGSIYTTKHWSDLKFPQRWSAKNLPECQGCEWITWCQGGCPYTRKLAYGTYDKKTPFCEAFKELFPMLMKLKERWECK